MSFVQDRATWHDMSQGPIQQTGSPLDVAIDGKAFLVVQTPRGERYTRNGALQINNIGELVTADGYQVIGESGPIMFQPTDRDIAISKDGTIKVREGNNAQTDSQRGQAPPCDLRQAAAVAEGRRRHFRGAGGRHAPSRQSRASCRARSRNRTCARSSR